MAYNFVLRNISLFSDKSITKTDTGCGILLENLGIFESFRIEFMHRVSDGNLWNVAAKKLN